MSLFRTWKSDTLKPMRKKFRLILTLLLCLTVPVAGWASVLSGPLCPQSHLHAASEVAAAHDQNVTYPVASAATDSERHHEHCGSIKSDAKPCKGEHCACGCGIGACSSTTLSLFPSSSASLANFADKQAVPQTDQPSYVGTRGTSPLRPPIS